MRNKKALLTGISLLLCFGLAMQGYNAVSAVPQLDTLILYMAPDIIEPEINATVTVTLVFKNLLDVEYDMFNVSTELFIPTGLNLTNVNNATFEDPDFDKDDLFVNGTDSTPIFFWNSTYFEVAWATFKRNETQTFNFVVDCLAETDTTIANPEVTYELDGEVETFTGSGITIDVRESEIPTRVSMPYRGEWVWYWWFTGALVVSVPLIAIFITRLTLWKR